MADDDALDGSIMDSTILVVVRSRFSGRKFLIPPMIESKFADRAPVGTPDSFRRSVSREDMFEKRLKRSDPDGCCCDADESKVVSCVILVVARTLGFQISI